MIANAVCVKYADQEVLQLKKTKKSLSCDSRLQQPWIRSAEEEKGWKVSLSLQCSGLHIHLPSEKSVVRFWEETEILWKFKPNIQSYLLWQPHVIKLKAAESSFFYSTVIMSFLAR